MLYLADVHLLPVLSPQSRRGGRSLRAPLAQQRANRLGALIPPEAPRPPGRHTHPPPPSGDTKGSFAADRLTHYCSAVSPGKGDPESASQSASRRRTPQGGRQGRNAGREAWLQYRASRRRGSHHRSQRPWCAESRKLEAVPGKQPAREGCRGEAARRASSAGSSAAALPHSPLAFCPGGGFAREIGRAHV